MSSCVSRLGVIPAVALPLLLLLLGRTTLAVLVNITLTDQSRMLTYGPSTVGVWNTSYTGSPWSARAPGQFNVGYGNSSSSTDVQGATVAFTFSGEAIYVLGQQYEGSCTIDVDGNTAPSRLVLSGGVLAMAQVTPGYHDVTVSWGGQAGLNFTGLILSVDLPGDQVETKEVLASSSNLTYNSVDFNYSPNVWSGVPEEAGRTGSVYWEAETFQTYANVVWNTPANASLMVLYGSVAPTDGPFSLNVSPSSNGAGRNTSLTGPVNQTLAANYTGGTTLWASENQVLAMRRLDTNVTSYTATLTNLGGRGLGFAWHSVVYYTATNSSSGGSGPAADSGSNSTTHTAAIAAGVAVPVGVLAILAILALVFRRRLGAVFGRRKASRKAQVDVFSDTGSVYNGVRPYAMPLERLGRNDSSLSGQSQIDILGEDSPRKGFLAASSRDETSTYHTLTGTLNSTLTGERSALRDRTTDSSGSAPSAGGLMADVSGAPLRLHGESGTVRSGDSVRGTELGGEREEGAEAARTPAQDVKSSSAGPSAVRGGATRRPPQRRRPVHDQDAGRITDPGVELLPPTYNPDWGRPNEPAEDAELPPTNAFLERGHGT